MDNLTLFGLFAVAAMLAFFFGICRRMWPASLYGFLLGA
jgi:hypothetical protein